MKTMKRIVSFMLVAVLCVGLFSVGASATEAETIDTTGGWELVLVSEEKQEIATYASGEKTGTWKGVFAIEHNGVAAGGCSVELKYKYNSNNGTSEFTSKEVTKVVEANGYSAVATFMNSYTGNQALLRLAVIKDGHLYSGDALFVVDSMGEVSTTLTGVTII